MLIVFIIDNIVILKKNALPIKLFYFERLLYYHRLKKKLLLYTINAHSTWASI